MKCPFCDYRAPGKKLVCRHIEEAHLGGIANAVELTIKRRDDRRQQKRRDKQGRWLTWQDLLDIMIETVHDQLNGVEYDAP